MYTQFEILAAFFTMFVNTFIHKFTKSSWKLLDLFDFQIEFKFCIELQNYVAWTLFQLYCDLRIGDSDPWNHVARPGFRPLDKLLDASQELKH